MEDIINDEVLGELKYLKSNNWGRRLDYPVLNSDGNLILKVQDPNKEGILDVQREAYKTYLQNEDKYKNCVTDLLLDYYKWNYEVIARTVSGLPESCHKDVITDKELYNGAVALWYLFICRDGSFGYVFGCCWDKENGIAVLLSETEPRVISRIQLENLHKLNDPTVGLLVHDGKKSWKGLERNKFFGVMENLEIEFEGGVDEGITSVLQKAYSQYLERKQNYFDELTKMMLGVFVGSDEKADAMLQTGQKIFIKSVLPKTLFIDRDGNYGWICYTEWDDSYIGVLLSDDKLYLMSERDLREFSKEEKIKDDLMGWLFISDIGFEGTVIVKLVNEILTLPLVISVGNDFLVTEKMKNAYLTYLKMKPTFWSDIKTQLLSYYLEDYEEFERNLEIPEELNKENVTEDGIMSIVTFKNLYINFLGHIGWEFDSPIGWDDGLAFTFDNGNLELVSQLDLL